MKLFLLVVTCSILTITVNIQKSISPEDKALLDTLLRDGSYITINRNAAEWMDEINNPKWALYSAFHSKSPKIVKVLKRQQVGLEGQYTLTWFAVDSGRATVVEAYFGDESGSQELQYVRQFQPDKVQLGHFDKKSWKCEPTLRFGNSKTEELCLIYNASPNGPADPVTRFF
jgi:hypothetical protein